jgi:hypothetical protein
MRFVVTEIGHGTASDGVLVEVGADRGAAAALVGKRLSGSSVVNGVEVALISVAGDTACALRKSCATHRVLAIVPRGLLEQLYEPPSPFANLQVSNTCRSHLAKATSGYEGAVVDRSGGNPSQRPRQAATLAGEAMARVEPRGLMLRLLPD